MMKNKIFLFIVLGIFLINFSSAFEFDNVGSYDKETKTITIENALGLGKVIGGAQLNTPQVYHVPIGYQKVAEFDLWAYEDYNNVLKNLEFYNKNYKDWDKHKFTRDYDIKYKTTKLVDEPIYNQSCYLYYLNSSNGNSICENTIIGYKQVEVEDWVKVTLANLKKNERLTIGIFTNVEVGDRVEWILSLYGVEVMEWAEWTEDLEVNLSSWWKFEEASGDFLDSIGSNNMSVTSLGYQATGIIDFGTSSNWATTTPKGTVTIDTTLQPENGDFSINTWINFSDTTQGQIIRSGAGGSADGYYIGVFGNKIRLKIADGSSSCVLDSTGNIPTNAWHMITLVYDNSQLYLFIDGSFSKKIGCSLGDITSVQDPYFLQSEVGGGGSHLGDEFGFWKRNLTATELSNLWNGGSGINPSGIFVTLNHPENNTALNDATVDFNWTIDPVGTNITNWTLSVWYENSSLAHQHINTTINTNISTTVIHNDTLFLDESYIWNVESCDTGENCALSDNWTFILDTAPPEVNITYPPEGFIVTTPQQNITLNYTVEHPVGNLSNCFYNTSSNSTPINISCTLNTTSLLYPITNPSNLTIYVFANDTAANLGSDNITIFKDTFLPTINITAPNGTLGYNYIGGNETLNTTFSDSNLDSCWYNYNGTNISIEGCLTGVKNSTTFILEEDNLNMTLYANDSLGNLNSTFIEWSYIILQLNETFEENITEGELDDFSILLDVADTSSLTDATFSYNGTNYTTTIAFSSGLYLISSLIVSPTVTENTNFSFNFFFVVDGITYNSSFNQQLVVNSLFDICGGISNDTLLNMSLVDEETGLSISGTIEIVADIVSQSSMVSVETINNTFENVEYGAICFTPESLYPSYYLNAEIKYFSDGYVSELYYIQNSDMTDYPRNLSLFNLNQTDSTEFVVTFQNDAFIFVEGAIIQLQRKYIGENVYKVVEAPITSDGGKAIVHIDLNTNIYRVSIVKDGELLKFFEEIVFSCENELAGECTEQLRGDVDPNNDIPIENLIDFSYSVSVSDDNNTVNVLFAVPSGTPSSVNVLLEQIDMFGNLTACNTTVITSAGSITCDFSDTIEKSILQLTISKDGTQLAITNYGVDPELDMDGINFFIVFLFLISLVGMAIASPEWMMIIGVMVFMISGTLLLLKGMSLAMGLGAMAWLVVAVIIIILKMAKQEDR